MADATNGDSRKKQRVELTQDADYIPKSILVTGGAGFIASHIVIQLVKQYPNYKVRVRAASTAAQPPFAAPVLSTRSALRKNMTSSPQPFADCVL